MGDGTLQIHHSSSIGKGTNWRSFPCAWYQGQRYGTIQLRISLTDNGVSQVISSLAGAIANKTRKVDSFERSVIFTFHADVPKAEGLYQKWVK
jgi:hypothetical protein